MAIVAVPIDGGALRYIALQADVASLPITNINVGDWVKVLDGPNLVWDGDSWEDEAAEDTVGTTTADGADVTQGTIADAAVAAGATGTISAKLRSISRDIALLVQETSQVAATAAITVVGDSAINVTVLAANAARKGATIFNTSSAILYLKFGATAVIASSWSVQIPANSYYELTNGRGIYTGILDGIWASDAGGSAFVTEW